MAKKKAAKSHKKITQRPKKALKVVKVETEEHNDEKRPTPGVYVYKPLKSKIVACSCGNKYIATRPKQRICFDCIREQALAAR